MGLDPLLEADQLFSFSTLMLLVASLTCKTVSRMTYTVLVKTLNPTHSLTHLPPVGANPWSPITSVNAPRLSPAKLAGTRLTTPEGWKAELSAQLTYVSRKFTCQQSVTLLSNNCAHCPVWSGYIDS